MNSFPDHQAQQRRGKHSDDRRNASTFCASIVTPDRMLPQVEEELQPPTEDPMLQDGVLSRATEYLLRLRKYSDGRQSMRCYKMGYYNSRQSMRCCKTEYSNGRQSTRCYKMEYSHSRQSTRYNCGNTLTADRVFLPSAQAS